MARPWGLGNTGTVRNPKYAILSAAAKVLKVLRVLKVLKVLRVLIPLNSNDSIGARETLI